MAEASAWGPTEAVTPFPREELAWLLEDLAWLLEELAWLLEVLAWLLEELAWLLEELLSVRAALGLPLLSLQFA
jgi:hypothetical protein